MEEAIIFRDFEEYALKLDSLLTKLRKQVGNFLKGRVSFTDLKPNIVRLRHYNELMNKTLSLAEEGEISSEYRDLFLTLVEFVMTVSLGEERDILETLRKALEKKGGEKERKLVADALNEMNILEESVKKIYSSLGKP